MKTYRGEFSYLLKFSSIYLGFFLLVIICTFVSQVNLPVWQFWLLFLSPIIIAFLIWRNTFIEIDSEKKILTVGWLFFFKRTIDIRYIVSITLPGQPSGSIQATAGFYTLHIVYERTGVIKRGILGIYTVFFSKKTLGDFREQMTKLHSNINWTWW